LDLALGRGCGIVNTQIASNGPLGAADAFGGLIKFGSHIEVADLRLATVDGIENHERVDLEIGEVEIDVNAVETDEEIDEGLLLFGGDVGQQSAGDHLTRGEWFIDGKLEDEGLGVDIADVNTTFVGEKDGVAFASRVDADVVLGIRWVGKEGLHDEVVQSAGY